MSFEAEESFEKKMRPIMAQIKRARLAAIPYKEMQNVLIEGERLAVEWSEGKVSEEEYVNRASTILDMPNIVAVRSIAEFSYCLRELLPEGEVRKILSHENAHMSRIEHHALKGQYQIAFATDDGGHLGIIPIAGFEHPVGMTFEELAPINEDITSAPDDLSEGDKAALELLRKQKKG
ncbi:MAG TPA: hypothetical protein VMH91_04290 [Candidatus Paceibacterota bacterium]|nr:hypothetical protein [Candidatus Paceibacterota bacterium]